MLNVKEFAEEYAAFWQQKAEEERIRMSVRWTVRSKEVHTSKATWIGEKPKDGGEAMVLEALRWAKYHRQPGQMVINLGTGGSVSDLSFVQTEEVPAPVAEFEATDEIVN